jgi:hypothetical protein
MPCPALRSRHQRARTVGGREVAADTIANSSAEVVGLNTQLVNVPPASERAVHRSHHSRACFCCPCSWRRFPFSRALWK